MQYDIIQVAGNLGVPPFAPKDLEEQAVAKEGGKVQGISGDQHQKGEISFLAMKRLLGCHNFPFIHHSMKRTDRKISGSLI